MSHKQMSTKQNNDKTKKTSNIQQNHRKIITLYDDKQKNIIIIKTA